MEEEPLVSVIIPNKDHSEDLDTAIRSLLEKGTWKNLEFIVVENNSTEQKTWAYYEKIQKELPNVHVVTWDGPFNFSAINNFGVPYAKGEYLLFMNNDVELINPDAVREMMGYAQRPDVGIVGCRLLYEDDTIQHAGVVIGFGGIAGHTFIGLHEVQNSYFHRAVTAQDYSAVTAACLMTKRSLFDQVGGFTEELAVAFNDVDYCLKIRETGKLVVYNPYALFHEALAGDPGKGRSLLQPESHPPEVEFRPPRPRQGEDRGAVPHSRDRKVFLNGVHSYGKSDRCHSELQRDEISAAVHRSSAEADRVLL